MSLLEVKELTKNFGGLAAVSNVDFAIEENELVGLIGPNGAGKNDLLQPADGCLRSDRRHNRIGDRQQKVLLNGKAPYKITDLGLARTFQNIRLFKELTVLDNVLIAMHSTMGENTFHSLLRTPTYYRKEAEMREKALELLAIFELEKKYEILAKNLPYGEQRRLEIVRALATNPKILFLDEPAAGMNPQETAELTALIRKIQKDFKITVVLIEHDMSLVMNVCERIYVLEYGRLLAKGTPEEIQKNPAVIKAYLGGD